MRKLNIISESNYKDEELDIVKSSISSYLYNKEHLNNFYKKMNLMCNEIYKSIFIHKDINNYLK